MTEIPRRQIRLKIFASGIAVAVCFGFILATLHNPWASTAFGAQPASGENKILAEIQEQGILKYVAQLAARNEALEKRLQKAEIDLKDANGSIGKLLGNLKARFVVESGSVFIGNYNTADGRVDWVHHFDKDTEAVIGWVSQGKDRPQIGDAIISTISFAASCRHFMMTSMRPSSIEFRGFTRE